IVETDAQQHESTRTNVGSLIMTLYFPVDIPFLHTFALFFVPFLYFVFVLCSRFYPCLFFPSVSSASFVSFFFFFFLFLFFFLFFLSGNRGCLSAPGVIYVRGDQVFFAFFGEEKKKPPILSTALLQGSG
ncbi:hypothetical protein Q2430_27110, partial [Escherichia coli]|nr:hypothetical protein [Escherichia coli]